MMNHSRRHRHQFSRLFCRGLVVVACCAGAVRAQSPEPRIPPARIAVINLRLVYENMQETIDFQKMISGMQKQLDADAASHRTELQGLQDASTRPSAEGGKTAHADVILDQLDQRTFSYAMADQGSKVRIQRLHARQMVKGFGEIKSTVSDLAIQKGLDLVLVNSGANLPPNAGDMVNAQTMANLVFNRSVLYTLDPVDITTEVIVLMNKNYKSPKPPEPPPILPSTSMQIGSKTFQMEIAADETSRSHGMMERDSITPGHGMIFVFPEAGEQNFWMHHTRFPLDIIYADDHGKIVSIKAMKPYDETPVPSDGAAKYGIELPAGQAAAAGLKPGDQLKIPPAVDASLKK